MWLIVEAGAVLLLSASSLLSSIHDDAFSRRDDDAGGGQAGRDVGQFGVWHLASCLSVG